MCVAEPARFIRSTGRVGLGVEEQHYGLTSELFERNGVSVFVRQGKLGSFVFASHHALSIQEILAPGHRHVVCGFPVRDICSRTTAHAQSPDRPNAAADNYHQEGQARPTRHSRRRIPSQRSHAPGAHRSLDRRPLLRCQPVWRQPCAHGPRARNRLRGAKSRGADWHIHHHRAQARKRQLDSLRYLAASACNGRRGGQKGRQGCRAQSPVRQQGRPDRRCRRRTPRAQARSRLLEPAGWHSASACQQP